MIQIFLLVSNSVTNIRWSFMDGGIKISWSPNLHFKALKNDDDIHGDKENNENIKAFNNTHSFYTIYYSHNLSTPFHEWKTKNVTNATETEVFFLLYKKHFTRFTFSSFIF